MVLIKICGVTNVSDAAELGELDIDFYGLNFIRSSPRYVDPIVAREIVENHVVLATPVGLFDLHERFNQLNDIVTGVKLQVLQVYNSDYFNFNTPYWTSRIDVFRIRDADDFAKMSQQAAAWKLAPEHRPYAVVIDSRCDRALGGTGHVAPWHLLAGFDPGVPVILAGGLTPENVAEAIRIVKPWGVDVASGVEKSPGVKDLHKVKAFIDAAREAGSAL